MILLTAMILLAVCILGAIFSSVPEVRAREAIAWVLIVGTVVIYLAWRTP